MDNIEYILKETYQWFRPLIYPLVARLERMDILDLLVVDTILITFIMYYYLQEPKKSKRISKFKLFQIWAFQQIVKFVPFVNAYIIKEKQKTFKKFQNDLDRCLQERIVRIPENGLSDEKIKEKHQIWLDAEQNIVRTGKVSGTMYITNEPKYESNMKEFIKNFLFYNGQNPDVFPSIRQMEAEVIRMTGALFGQEKEGIGLFTAGGTESILLAMLAYRNQGKTCGITNPNMYRMIHSLFISVVFESAHAAFFRACNYFNIEARIAPMHKTTRMSDYKQMKKLIDSNTLCLVGSLPSFPHGNRDQIENLAKLAKRNKIGLHVDCCLGGFVVAFAKENGYDLGEFDFRLDGVTSISCDHHKYALAPKGSSTILFKTHELRGHAIFALQKWGGPAYLSSTFAGTRNGATIAGAWYALVSQGRKKLAEQSKKIMEGTQEIARQVREQISELEVIGEPEICVVAFKSNVVNIYGIYDIMAHEKGWELASQQYPAAIHISVTLANIGNIKQLISDFKDSIRIIQENPKKYKKTGEGTMYGTTQAIPDNQFVEHIIKELYDAILYV